MFEVIGYGPQGFDRRLAVHASRCHDGQPRASIRMCRRALEALKMAVVEEPKKTSREVDKSDAVMASRPQGGADAPVMLMVMAEKRACLLRS